MVLKPLACYKLERDRLTILTSALALRSAQHYELQKHVPMLTNFEKHPYNLLPVSEPELRLCRIPIQWGEILVVLVPVTPDNSKPNLVVHSILVSTGRIWRLISRNELEPIDEPEVCRIP